MKIECLKHGVCDKETGVCNCTEGWSGDDCGRSSCPENCRGHGICDQTTGLCRCDHWWEGRSCQNKICLNNCNGNGACLNGTCSCFGGWRGVDCSVKVCPDECSGHGKCYRGACLCEPNWSGEACADAVCKDDCNGRGECVNLTCYCPDGWRGEACELKLCLNSCTNHGICNYTTGVCTCHEGFGGEDCSQVTCPNNCTDGNGVCDQQTAKCICNADYSGIDCSYPACPDDCSKQGECVNGTCWCDPKYRGDNCSIPNCPNNCSFNGVCGFRSSNPDDQCRMECLCEPGWAGEDCSLLACGQRCIGASNVCDKGVSVTLEPQQLEEFRTPLCCSHHGICMSGECQCDPGWGGGMCEIPLCPGECVHGKCYSFPPSNETDKWGVARCGCYEGWDGPTCEEPLCKDGCNGNGICIEGTCACFKGWDGESCNEQTYNGYGLCSDQCADHCSKQCRSTFLPMADEEMGVGKKCFVGCSKKCFTHCLRGEFKAPEGVGRCDTPECKLLKRTMLDMEGVFADAEDWFEKANSGPDLTSLVQETAAGSAGVVDGVAAEAGVDADQAALMMTGRLQAAAPVTSKQLSDSILTGLSDKDSQLLEQIMAA